MPRKRQLAKLILISLALALIACGKPTEKDEPAPLATVKIETITVQPLSIHSELSGRLIAPRSAEVRARVAGVVLERSFREGSDVKQGDVLFRIDPAPLQVDLDSAQASLRKAQANEVQARQMEQRYARLIESRAISDQEYDNARTASQQANADVALVQSAVSRATLNLSYATVTAPISGRIGRALVTEGALVGEGESTPLALIQQLNPIHADLAQSPRELNDLRQALRAGHLQSVAADQVKATLILDDESAYALPGKLLFTDIGVDPSTGQIIQRSEFPNPYHDLLPGSFVRVRVEQALNQQGISVPQRAILRDSAGIAQVLLLDASNRVGLQPVELGQAHNGRWTVTGGLEAGDRIIVEGLQHARAGEQVQIDGTQNSPAQVTGL